MNENLIKALSLYCNSEIANFENSELFIEMQNLVKELNYTLVCDYGKELDNKKSENLYLSITIYDSKNEIIEIFDDGFLVASTMLVLVDKKQRLKFFSWEDEDFIDSLNWIIRNLKEINKL